MAIYEFEGLTPVINEDTFIFDSADIIGQVVLESGVSVWSNATIRGDNAAITVGRNSNVQESSVLHVDTGVPLTVGANVTIGHQAMLHGCTIMDGALIGIQAIVLNHARIGRNCLIGAGAIIPEGRDIPDNSLVVGVGKVLRELTPEEIRVMHENTAGYVQRAREYRQGLKRIG